MNRYLILFSCLIVVVANAQKTPAPEVPDALKPPDGTELLLVAHARGSQIYTCQASQDGKFAWTLKAPEAELHDDKGALIGYHSAGPTWKLNDGSGVKGKVVAKANEEGTIPWLLLTVTDHLGAGTLGRATAVQRLNTKDGLAPAAGCDGSSVGKEAKSSYSADYFFYGPKN